MRRTFLVFVLGSCGWLVCAQGPAPAPQLGSFQGTVTDAQNKPVPGALVMITRTFRTPNEAVTPYSQSVKTASDGSFLAQGFPPGTYTYCAQATDDSFLDGCRWGAPLLDVKVSAGQKVRAAIRVAKGSILKVQLLDPGKAAASLAHQPSNGKNAPPPPPVGANLPPLLMGVFDGHGRYAPVHYAGSDNNGHNYQLVVPLDTPLSLQVSSAKLKLADSTGAALPANAAGAAGASSQSSQTAFQHNSGDPNPKSFQFTITGVNP